jgi:hypothetical protein
LTSLSPPRRRAAENGTQRSERSGQLLHFAERLARRSFAGEKRAARDRRGYYNIGFASSPRNRTGFAHLFEHLCFKARKISEKWNISSSFNLTAACKRLDALRFHELLAVVPSHKLETLLWAEADRMRGLDIRT